MKSKVEGETQQRKERADKKREVRPIVNQELYDFISRISYITNRPMKDVGEMIITHSLNSNKVMTNISKYFRKDFFWDDRILFRGQPERNPYKYPTGVLKTRLPSFRFRREIYDRISDISYALDTSVAQAAALLLETSIDHTQIVNRYIAFYVEEELLDEKRLKQLKEIIRYINKGVEERVTLVELLNYLKDELFQAGRNFKTTFVEWIDRHYSE